MFSLCLSSIWISSNNLILVLFAREFMGFSILLLIFMSSIPPNSWYSHRHPKHSCCLSPPWKPPREGDFSPLLEKQLTKSIHTKTKMKYPPLLLSVLLGPSTWHMISKDIDRYRCAIDTWINKGMWSQGMRVARGSCGEIVFKSV